MRIDFAKEGGLMPTVVQDAATGEVLMLAYSSKESLAKTLRTKRAWFWSRSRKRLWKKGEESGNELAVEEVAADCDSDSLLFKVRVKGKGVACHTGKKSCFFNFLKKGKRKKASASQSVLQELFSVIEERKKNSKKEAAAGSYVASIVGNRKKIVEKLREECGELIEAAEKKPRKEIIWEAADLLFFELVLLANRGVKLEQVLAELERRRGARRG